MAEEMDEVQMSTISETMHTQEFQSSLPHNISIKGNKATFIEEISSLLKEIDPQLHSIQDSEDNTIQQH
jgi:hypothetical protein